MAPTKSDSAVAQQNSTESKLTENAGVQKRGRGRPPKPGGTVKKAPSGLPRGRPKGTTNKPTTSAKATGSKATNTRSAGTRGRPRKSDVATTTATPASKAKATPTSGRGRGRPAKKAEAKTASAEVQDSGNSEGEDDGRPCKFYPFATY